MQKVKKMFKSLSLALFIVGFFAAVNVNAQTPANDPGIGGPGVGTQPQGDGSPVVPFDEGMSLIFLASGISYATKKLKVK